MLGFRKCDRCGKIHHSSDAARIEHKDGSAKECSNVRVDINYHKDWYNKLGNYVFGVEEPRAYDLCPDCFQELLEFLNNGKTEDNKDGDLA